MEWTRSPLMRAIALTASVALLHLLAHLCGCPFPESAVVQSVAWTYSRLLTG